MTLSTAREQSNSLGIARAGTAPAPAVESPVAAVTADLVNLAAAAHVGLFQVDAERNLVAVTPEMERITGFSAAEVLGKPCLSLIRCQTCLRSCGILENGQIEPSRLTLYRKDGGEVEVVRSGVALHTADGMLSGALESVRLVDSDSESRAGSRELDTLLTGLSRMYIVADQAMRVITTSAALPTLLGMTDSAMRGLPLARLFGESLFGIDRPFRTALQEGKRREGWRAELQTVAGARLPVSLSAGPIDAGSHCGEEGARYILMMRSDDEEENDGEIPSFAGIVGRSTVMQRIFRLIDLLRDNDATVLITGESGTGKELVARALHARSGRAHGPFVAVNCAALPSELLESELFGHVRGAFTGAVRDRAGRFELADRGTLFLDEIGDLAPSLQAKLLRVLQEHAFERVGETRTRRVDVRVIAATHVDLGRAVSEGRFREDLYYRLRVLPIHVPPLRERRDDLALLIPHLLRQIGGRRGRSLRLAPTTMRALVTYDWPGNVRELENTLEYATAICEGQTVHLRDLPPNVVRGSIAEAVPRAVVAAERPVRPAPPSDLDEGEADLDEAHTLRGDALTAQERAEIEAMREALERSHYRRSDAAAMLAMSRTTFWRKMKQYRL